MNKIVSRFLGASLLASLAVGCQGGRSDDAASLGQREQPVVNVEQTPTVSLLRLGDRADWHRVASVIEQTGGQVFEVSAPRFMIARLATGSQAVLTDAGMVERYDRAVEPSELPRASTAEARFVTVFSNRYFRSQVPDRFAIKALSTETLSTEPFEGEPRTAPQTAAVRTLGGEVVSDDDAARAAEDNLMVPYASGTVVVAIVLPESNGVAEPSTENWNEAAMLATYAKVQAALEGVARREPGAKLRFVMHYASAPGERGLEGTVDTDWEFGKHVAYGADNQEPKMVATIMSRLLGREIPDGQYFQATRDYLNGLRRDYDADGAFLVLVAANQNGTAGLRAHAYLNGPYTVVSSSIRWQTYMHEFGHIFGAADEYCPDACQSPTGLQGYLGMINANATFREGDFGGINRGKGEDQPSLMKFNRANEINGYTRGAWGWIDTDGDGLIEVRDTFPKSSLTASVDGDTASFSGLIVDVPATPLGRTPFSMNRIVALEYRFADLADSPWLRIALPADTRGRQHVDVTIDQLPAGTHQVELRAVNSVGNIEPTPQRFSLRIAEEVGPNSAPFVSLTAASVVGRVSGGFRVTISALDLDGDVIDVRMDTDGDGALDTDVSRLGDIELEFDRPGIYRLRARAQDRSGASRESELELLVLAADAATPVAFATPTPSPRHGSTALDVRFSASTADPDVELNWIQEIDSLVFLESTETGFAQDNGSFDAQLRTPQSLVSRTLDITTGDAAVVESGIFDVASIDENTLALALGHSGIATVDISNRDKPQLLARIELQSVARHLKIDGNRLFVLGKTLSVVDVSNVRAPRELLQYFSERNVRISRNRESVKIPEGDAAYHSHDAPWQERIASIAVAVVIDHPAPSDLTIELVPPREFRLKSIVLRDREDDTPGRHRYRFNDRNTPALAALVGKFAAFEWSIVVTDNEKNRVEGTFEASAIRFRTRHRAAPVMDSATSIVGIVDRDYIVVAGDGLQVLDAGFSRWISEVARVNGTATQKAAIVGSTVIVAAATDAGKNRGAYWMPYTGSIRGLSAVDLSFPYWPMVTRTEPELNSRELAVVGSRFYARPQYSKQDFPTTKPAVTLVGDVHAFAYGGEYRLGESDFAVSSDAFGDDSSMWSRGSNLTMEKLDVSDPAEIRLLRSYSGPQLWSNTVRIGGSGDSTELLVPADQRSITVRLDDVTSTISRVFRTRVQARRGLRDAAATETSRAVHLIPYDNAPVIDAVEVVAGRDVGDVWQVRVDVSDADSATSWDPRRLVRADTDGDGIYDTPWTTVSRVGALFNMEFAEVGTYTLRFQARDGFWATSESSITLDVGEDIPRECAFGDGSCSRNEFCKFEQQNSCGSDGQLGLCTRFEGECRGAPVAEVCGCDGVTYQNECLATASGASVAREGVCPVQACAGSAGDTCSDQQLCTYPNDDVCGEQGGEGACTVRPVSCPLFLDPVCGCDGVTYDNFCQAAQRGTDVLHRGGCAVDDCRSRGCGEGETCSLCFARWTCQPDGVRC